MDRSPARRTNSAPNEPSRAARVLRESGSTAGGKYRGAGPISSQTPRGYYPPSLPSRDRNVTFADSIHSGGNSDAYYFDHPFNSETSVSPSPSWDRDSSFVAPTSRGNEFPLLSPALALRGAGGPRSKLWVASVVCIGLLGVGVLVGVCALLALDSHSHSSGVPSGMQGIGGYTVRTRTQASYDAMVTFLNTTLRTHALYTCADGGAYSALVLPNRDVITLLAPQIAPSSNTHAYCPVIHFRVEDLQAWVRYLRGKRVPALGTPLACAGVEWQYFTAPDGNTIAVSAAHHPDPPPPGPSTGGGPAPASDADATVTAADLVERLTEVGAATARPAARRGAGLGAAAQPRLFSKGDAAGVPVAEAPREVAASPVPRRRGEVSGAPSETRAVVSGVSYAGSLYDDDTMWHTMSSFWTGVMGLTCTSCPAASPKPGGFATFPLADGDRVQMYFDCPVHRKFMNQCSSPGLEVGTYTELMLWYEYLQADAPGVSIVNEPYKYETEQGWFWISVPDGTKWNGTSARHNVMEIVASANVVQPHEP